jgi:DNA polymerase elongation subunit (family B)
MFKIIPATEATRGRPPIFKSAMNGSERARRFRAARQSERIEHIAILDFETDPFDNLKGTEVQPFLAVLYSDNFETVIIWEENHAKFIDAVLAAIVALPEKYTIYAHNGGKFDYLFLLHKLRGFVSFKGRAIMSATIGNHELRDSFHIIPEKLANWQKDTFDYNRMKRGERNKWKEEIIRYCVNDCKYLLEIVKKFLEEFGFKISIGQAAMYELKKHYKTATIGEQMDGFLRQWFFGGRVECLSGAGHFIGDYKLYDVNSMYPYVMANMLHPIGSEFTVRTNGKINSNTVFLEIEGFNRGGFVTKGQNGETTAEQGFGIFNVTIHEYNVALKYGLIERPRILRMIDCDSLTRFDKFVLPLYERRQETKAKLHQLKPGTYEYNEIKKDDIFIKLIMNNAYGKFAQNPRRFKETYITGPHEKPPEFETGFGSLPVFDCDSYAIWERPTQKLRFNNVATAASITGAARAILMEAIELADDPIYCDTDSLICRNLSGVSIDAVKLGSWDIEKEIIETIICGKKLYAYKTIDGKIIIRSKGSSGLTWKDMESILKGQVIETLSKGITLTKRGEQYYMRRRIRSTAVRVSASPIAKRISA